MANMATIPAEDDVPPLSPSSSIFSPSDPIPISPQRRRSDGPVTPKSPAFVGLPGLAGFPGRPRKRLSFSGSHIYAFNPDHIPLERGGSTEGRRRSAPFSASPSLSSFADLQLHGLGAPFSLPEPAIQDESDEEEEIEQLVAGEPRRVSGVARERALPPLPETGDGEEHAEPGPPGAPIALIPHIPPTASISPSPSLSQPAPIPLAAPPVPSVLSPLPSLPSHSSGLSAAAAAAASPAPPQAPPAAVPHGPVVGGSSTPGGSARSLSAAVRRRIDRSKALYLRLKDIKDDNNNSSSIINNSNNTISISNNNSNGSSGQSSAETSAPHLSYPLPPSQPHSLSPSPQPVTHPSSASGSAGSTPVPGSASPSPSPSASGSSGRATLKSLISRRRLRAQSLSFSSNIPFGSSHSASQPSSVLQSNRSSATQSPSPANPHTPSTASLVDSGYRHAMCTGSGTGSAVMGAGPVAVGPSTAGNGVVATGVTGASAPAGPSYATFPRRAGRSYSLPLPPPPFNVVLTSAGLQPVGSDELVWGTLSYRAPSKQNTFGTRLPRELKIKVFSTILDTYAARPGPGRWDGVNAGRRELVRLSRVSKEWRSLCFDGQLWAHADFTAFAAVMHPGTLREILAHAQPCVRDLSVRGLDRISGWSLTVREMPAASFPPAVFSSLTTLDLFGCHNLTSKDIINLLSISPNLKSLNLKGSRLSLVFVLQAIARHVTALEELDVSRCWSLEFLDIEVFLASLNERQQAALRTLRIAGLTAATGGHIMQRIGRLPNLTTLDLLGCKWLGALDIADYVTALAGRPSPLTHLIISGCTNLTSDALELLVDRLPHMRIFEAASLEPVFYLDPPPTLARLVRSMPLLTKLDLDSTGRYGGVCNRLLEELIPGPGLGKALRHSHLEELRIGGAKNISAQTILRVINALPQLGKIEVDGTEADNAVLRAFLARPRPAAAISLVDCHRVTHDVFSVVAGRTRARAGWEDYRGTVFAYTHDEMEDKPVLKTFWAWRAVRPPKVWREARDVGEAGHAVSDRQVVIKTPWWRASEDVDEMERGACTIM